MPRVGWLGMAVLRVSLILLLASKDWLRQKRVVASRNNAWLLLLAHCQSHLPLLAKASHFAEIKAIYCEVNLHVKKKKKDAEKQNCTEQFLQSVQGLTRFVKETVPALISPLLWRQSILQRALTLPQLSVQGLWQTFLWFSWHHWKHTLVTGSVTGYLLHWSKNKRHIAE